MRDRLSRFASALFVVACRVGTSVWFLIVLIPMLLLLALSFSSGTGNDDLLFRAIPVEPTVENYPEAFSFMDRVGIPLSMAIFNSVVATGIAIVCALALASMAGWALAMYRFPGRGVVLALFALGLVVPTSIMIVPEFLTVRLLSLSGRPALWLPYIAFGLALPTVIITSFFRSLPKQVFEAARLDGARGVKMFIHVGIPLIRPALGTAGVFLFLVFWNEFPLALTLIRDTSETTVPLAIASTQARFGTPFNTIAAMMVITTLPALAAFILGQRQLVEGLGSGMLKR